MIAPSRLLAALAILPALAGCAAPQDSPSDGEAGVSGPFFLESSAFEANGRIPQKYTCDGEDVSPPLTVSGVPSEASTVALLVVDPDVPLPATPLREVVHWTVWDANVSGGRVVFPEGGLPAGAIEGNTGMGDTGWRGPCPPAISPPHRYQFTAHAVAGSLGLPPRASREALEQALEEKSIAAFTLVGMYERAKPSG